MARSHEHHEIWKKCLEKHRGSVYQYQRAEKEYQELTRNMPPPKPEIPSPQKVTEPVKKVEPVKPEDKQLSLFSSEAQKFKIASQLVSLAKTLLADSAVPLKTGCITCHCGHEWDLLITDPEPTVCHECGCNLVLHEEFVVTDPDSAPMDAAMAKSKKRRCWKGYEPVPGMKPYSKKSCRPIR